MKDLYLDNNGMPRKYSDLEAANKIVDARKKGDIWEVIDLLVHLWAKRAPDEVRALSINIDEYKANQVDKEFATTKSGKDMERRLMLSFPTRLMLMIRTQYKADELQFDKIFYNKFAKKYPFFMVGEKN